ncbi:MAG TPA: hypothetical protein PLZ16_15805, partial [Gammaproteobacteria bacterium]|nr:hypothetical protein [Gammaproteobacteria bacterium]
MRPASQILIPIRLIAETAGEKVDEQLHALRQQAPRRRDRKDADCRALIIPQYTLQPSLFQISAEDKRRTGCDSHPGSGRTGQRLAIVGSYPYPRLRLLRFAVAGRELPMLFVTDITVLQTDMMPQVVRVQRLPVALEVGVERHGVVVSWESDGARGLAEALRHRFDAVLLDVMLPGLDGIEVCRRLR